MNLQDVGKLLRARWPILVATTLLAMLGAIALTALTTPLYQASTRLFLSTTSGASAADRYQGNRLSQDRVLSYTVLLEGETVAQRTIDRLGLTMSASQLRSRVQASAKTDTVLIDVAVLDASPVRARDIANALSDEFVLFVRELETPRPGALPDARVIVEQRASLPAKPVIPNTKKTLGAGLLIGLFAGIGLAIIRDMLDNTVKLRETVEEITGVSVIGSIPVDKERRLETAIPFESSHSPIAEAFRKLRTNLHFIAVDNPPRVIVITSSTPNEGKSTTAINLALSLAEAEHNVVLVDGDLRRPSVHTYLNLVGSIGFSTVLSGEANLTDVLQQTAFKRLTVLAAGVSPPNPSELLGSLAAKRLLEELRTQFDYVIVDSPPLLAVTDGAILAANSDGAIMVVRFGKTKREQLSQALQTIDAVGAKLLGTLFSMTPSRGGSSYGYYNYYYNDAPSEPTSDLAGRSRPSWWLGRHQRKVNTTPSKG
jgi:capsular exopolysaccharide synthesis family protein